MRNEEQPGEKRPVSLQDRLDSWFPTVVRYAGLVVVFYGAFVDHLHNAALIAAGVGMIAFKSIWGKSEKGDA